MCHLTFKLFQTWLFFTLPVSHYVTAFEFTSIALIGQNLSSSTTSSTAMFQEKIGTFQKILHVGGIIKIYLPNSFILNYTEPSCLFLNNFECVF